MTVFLQPRRFDGSNRISYCADNGPGRNMGPAQRAIHPKEVPEKLDVA
jgi:hypothetical protein